MEISQLRTFLTAAELQGFTPAARRLNFSQSAVSQQIRELETSLDLRLFERRSRSVVLTPAGERLLPLARRILANVDDAKQAMAELAGGPQGVVDVGACLTIANYVVPALVSRFAAGHPGARLRVEVGNTAELMYHADAGRFDVVLQDEPMAAGKLPGWSQRYFGTEPVLAVATPALAAELQAAEPGHPWPVAAWPLGSAHWDRVERGLSLAGQDPQRLRIMVEVGSVEVLKRVVATGSCVGFLPRCAVAEELAAHQLVELDLPGFEVATTFWLFSSERAKNVMGEAFIDSVLAG